MEEQEHWCMHEDCLCQPEPFTSLQELKAHMKLAHPVPLNVVLDIDGTLISDHTEKTAGWASCGAYLIGGEYHYIYKRPWVDMFLDHLEVSPMINIPT